jgi:hypothetical protein
MEVVTRWLGARVNWRFDVADEIGVVFDGHIDTAEDVGDGIIRISGPLTSGSRFVLVTDEPAMR